MEPMNWKECARQNELYLGHSRFEWPSGGLNGFNCSDAFTFSDIWGAISWLWTWPGDWLLRSEPLNTFMEIDPLVTGSPVSSGFMWAALFIVGMALTSRIAE